MTSGMVPMLSPDGQSGDIPAERVNDAVAAGFKPAVVMTAPNGQMGYVPHDRAAEAVKAGFKVGQPAAQDKPDVPGGWHALGSDLMDMAKSAPSLLPPVAIYNQLKHTVDNYKSVRDSGKTLETRAGDAREQAGYSPAYSRVAAPLGEAIGANVSGMEQAAQQGDVGGVVGHAAAVPAVLAASKGIAEGGPALADTKLAGAVKAPIETYRAYKAGPIVRTMADAAKLPPNVVLGTEDIIRAAAPTGMNQGFRANTYAAAGDLAEIGRKLDFGKSAGGALSPDMRVRATVDAINNHLADMYQTERAPQIASHANVPVDTAIKGDAADALQYLSRRAGQEASRSIAAQALEEGTIPLADADKLAMVVNQELKGFESMTPADRAAASMTNRRMFALKSLDSALSNKINGILQDSGEPGLRSYERRYAALSEVRDQLATRMNATEIQRSVPGARAVKGLMGGVKGIASASQAAVADVNIGKSLERGFTRLKGSEIMPDRSYPITRQAN